jgi:hypothetical protein
VVKPLLRQVSLDDGDRDRCAAGGFVSHAYEGEVVGGRR